MINSIEQGNRISIEFITRQNQLMHSHRQTLSGYIKRQNDLRNSKNKPSQSILSQRDCKCPSEMVILKKLKIQSLMSSILNEVNTDDNKGQQFIKIQKIIDMAAWQIKNDVDQIQQYYQSKGHSQAYNNQQAYVITVNNKIYDSSAAIFEQSVLRQVRQNGKQTTGQVQRAFKSDNRDSERSIISNPLVKQRSRRSNQNSQVIQCSNGNKQQDFDYSINQDVLNRAFDRKQFRKGSQKDKIGLKYK